MYIAELKILTQTFRFLDVDYIQNKNQHHPMSRSKGLKSAKCIDYCKKGEVFLKVFI